MAICQKSRGHPAIPGPQVCVCTSQHLSYYANSWIALQTDLIVELKFVVSQLVMFRSSETQFRQSPAGVDACLVQLVLVTDQQCGFKLAGRYQRLSYGTVTRQRVKHTAADILNL